MAQVTSSTSFTVTPMAPLLQISKATTNGATYFWDGEDIEFTLTVRNSGGGTAYSVVVLDTLPALLLFAGSATAPTDSYLSGPPARLGWDAGDLGAGMTVTVRFTVRALAPTAESARQDNLAGAWTTDALSATSFTVEVWRSLPGAPPSLSALAGDLSVSLAWDAVAPARYALVGYNIYRSSVPGGPKALAGAVAGRWNTAWTDPAVEPGSTYCYEVRALDGNGGEGMPSPSGCADFGSVAPPEGPIHIVVTVTDATGRQVRVLLDSSRGSHVTSVVAGEGREAMAAKTGDGMVIELSDGTRLVWDTRDSGGRAVPNGFYTVRVVSTGPDGKMRVATDTIALVRPYEKLLASARLVPNPAREGVWLAWTTASPLAEVSIRVYNLAGELVFKEGMQAGTASYRWNLRNRQGTRVVSGLYIVVFEARDPLMNRTDRRLVRLGVQ